MKKLTKAHAQKRTEFQTRLNTTMAAIKANIEKINTLIEETEDLQSTFNSIVEEVNAFTQSVYEEQQSYYDDRSERWYESEAADEYQSWMDEWDGFALDEIDMMLDQLDESPEGEDYADQLGDLPDAV